MIYNGVDYQKIQRADHSRWKTDETIKMVIVGGVIPNKGQYQAIEALCMLPKELQPHFTLDVIGGITETYKSKLKEPLKKCGIENQVKSKIYMCLADNWSCFCTTNVENGI